MTITRKANRKFPSLPVVAGDLPNHTEVLMAVKSSLDIGQRRTSDFLSSFVQVRDLVDLGVIDENGNFILEISDDDGGGGTGTVESVVAGSAIDVDVTDPANPVVRVEAAVTNAKLLTEDNQTAPFPNSRRVVAGTNVTFDDSVANVRTVNVASGGGSKTFLQEVTVAGAAASTITVSSLDLSTDELYEVELMLDNATASAISVSLFFNGDTTTTNYDRNVSTIGGVASATNDAAVGQVVASSTSRYRLSISNDFDGRPRTLLDGSSGNTTTCSHQVGCHMWRTAANVTSFTINSSVANGFNIGSRVRVWKVLS